MRAERIDMLEILTKKEAIKKMVEGEEVYATYNFDEYIKIEKVEGYALKDGKRAIGDRLLFAMKTNDDTFKTVNNTYLQMERITWERLRDVYINYIQGLPIGSEYFLIEDEEIQYSEIWEEENFKCITYERLCEYKYRNIYMFRIKKEKNKKERGKKNVRDFK